MLSLRIYKHNAEKKEKELSVLLYPENHSYLLLKVLKAFIIYEILNVLIVHKLSFRKVLNKYLYGMYCE